MKPKTIVTVIPAYNEGLTIGSMILGSLKYFSDMTHGIIQLFVKIGKRFQSNSSGVSAA